MKKHISGPLVSDAVQDSHVDGSHTACPTPSSIGSYIQTEEGGVS